MYALFILALLPFVFANEDELKIDILSKPVKCEREAKAGDMLTMHYKGQLLDGSEFDNSYNRTEPFTFQLGVGQVIKGWEQGLLGICVDEERRLTVPHHLGYGEKGAGTAIPPKSTLVFEVKCLKIEDGESPTNVFNEIDKNKDKQLSREEISDYLGKQMPADAERSQLPEHDKLVEEIFQHEDHDKNGYISYDEFSGPKHDEL